MNNLKLFLFFDKKEPICNAYRLRIVTGWVIVRKALLPVLHCRVPCRRRSRQ